MGGLIHPPTYAYNTIALVSLGGGGEPAVSGGRASAGNSCDDGSCTARGERFFYLTESTHMANQVLTACASGYHMASLWEILDLGTLSYNTSLGDTNVDSGSGPLSNSNGWIRTGSITAGVDIVGVANCFVWTSIDGEDYGIAAYLNPDWALSSSSTPTSPWRSSSFQCTSELRVWCVQY